ncbi:MAG TPA: hypothetical protein VJ824_03105 [Bacillota bacterium]|nr:hypothetical protein [Bacillota bacterium]
MNRKEFFQEAWSGIFNTMKELALPILENKVEKFDHSIESLIKIKWVPLSVTIQSDFRGWKEVYLDNGHWVYLYYDGSQLKAFDKVCTSCRSLTVLWDHHKVIKCLLCEKSLSLETLEGNLTIEEMPVKEMNQFYSVGISV